MVLNPFSREFPQAKEKYRKKHKKAHWSKHCRMYKRTAAK